jgi:F-type H+-transporting ATPase subunit b
MDLVTPSLGLIFWTTLVFAILLFLLAKYAWKPILGAVKDREDKINNALEAAEKAQKEMQAMQSKNEDLLKEARAERDAMMKESKETGIRIVEEAKAKSKDEAAKIIEEARKSIELEKSAAIAELKSQVASFSLEIAERILDGELAADSKQKALADKLVDDINLN